MYSQRDEEPVILEYFGKYRGVFLDLGAYDGVALSNTRALAELGWYGVAVEAAPSIFAKLEENYRNLPKVQLINVAIGLQNEQAIFFDSNGDCCGTLLSNETDRWQEIMAFRPTLLPCVTIRRLLDSINCPQIDMISCDLEGIDLHVLQDLPLQALRTRLLVIEYNGHNLRQFSDIMHSRGYQLKHRTAENLIWIVDPDQLRSWHKRLRK